LDYLRTLAGMMKLIAREHLQSQLGSRFLYSNDGYIVLGAIIQAVTGQSYESYVREHILEPAAMTHTGLSTYTPAQVSGMAHRYALAGTNPALHDNSGTPQIASPSGGANSTVGDLLKFAQALLGHKLLSPAMTGTVLAPRVNAPRPGGPPVDKYTYGFAYQVINGVTFIGHNGGTPGYEGQLDIYPPDRLRRRHPHQLRPGRGARDPKVGSLAYRLIAGRARTRSAGGRGPVWTSDPLSAARRPEEGAHDRLCVRPGHPPDCTVRGAPHS
jgi:CubicO group peptidase (beta-lactamase class C family)